MPREKIEVYKNFRVLPSDNESKHVLLVFTAMGTKIEQYGFFLSALRKKGYQTIIYDYPVELVLDARFDEFEDMYDALLHDVHTRMKAIMNTTSDAQFYAYGVSMGTLLANRVARNTKEIKRLILSLTYGDVADHIMESPVTRKTRSAMKKKGITVQELRDYVLPYDPIQHADGLHGKKVLLHLSRTDRALNFNRTLETKRALIAAGVDLDYQESKYLGHYGAGIKHMIKTAAIDKFLRS